MVTRECALGDTITDTASTLLRYPHDQLSWPCQIKSDRKTIKSEREKEKREFAILPCTTDLNGLCYRWSQLPLQFQPVAMTEKRVRYGQFELATVISCSMPPTTLETTLKSSEWDGNRDDAIVGMYLLAPSNIAAMTGSDGRGDAEMIRFERFKHILHIDSLIVSSSIATGMQMAAQLH